MISSDTHVWYKIDQAARILYKSDYPRDGFMSVPREGAANDVEGWALDVFKYDLELV